MKNAPWVTATSFIAYSSSTASKTWNTYNDRRSSTSIRYHTRKMKITVSIKYYNATCSGVFLQRSTEKYSYYGLLTSLYSGAQLFYTFLVY